MTTPQESIEKLIQECRGGGYFVLKQDADGVIVPISTNFPDYYRLADVAEEVLHGLLDVKKYLDRNVGKMPPDGFLGFAHALKAIDRAAAITNGTEGE